MDREQVRYFLTKEIYSKLADAAQMESKRENSKRLDWHALAIASNCSPPAALTIVVPLMDALHEGLTNKNDEKVIRCAEALSVLFVEGEKKRIPSLPTEPSLKAFDGQ